MTVQLDPASPDNRQLQVAEFLARLAAAPPQPLLDGTTPIDRSALAPLALERARMGAWWLARVIQPDGSFPYVYYPRTDAYDSARYNEVRHAGTTFSLFQACDIALDSSVPDAAEAAASYIAATSIPTPFGGQAYAYHGRAKLGGQALALVALLERRHTTHDRGYDPLISDLAAFLHAMELPAEPGRYHQSYEAANQQLLLTPDSDYYPGEALLALTRLAQHFPDGPHLAAAQRAAAYLIRHRDGDIIAAGIVPRQDHWLTIALGALFELDPNPDYAAVAFLQAESMIDTQHQDDDPEPWRIGAAFRTPTVNFTSTATRAEALLAAWQLAARRDDTAATERFSHAALRTVQFLIRVQYTEALSKHFPRPDRVIGGWAQDAANPRIRLDFVQHNISALIGAWRLIGNDHITANQLAAAPNVAAPSETTLTPAGESPEFGFSTKSIFDAARSRGIPFRENGVESSLIELGNGAHRRRFLTMTTSKTPGIGIKIAKDKHLTNELLRAAGIPVPRGALVSTVEEAVEAAARIGYPVVLKPVSGNQGRSVFAGVDNERTVRQVFPSIAISRRSSGVLVEQHITGHDYRVLVINDQVVGANLRVPAEVLGDGVNTIRALIDIANADPLRGEGMSNVLTRIVIDAQTTEALQRQGLTLEDVPEDGQNVPVKLVSNTSAGGTARDHTGKIHPDNAAIARLAARTVGLDIAGVDLIALDIAQSVWTTGGAIIEVNSGPGFRQHLRPYEGEPRDVGKAVIDMLFPPGQPFRVPIIAVAGCAESTLTCQLIAHIMTTAGHAVGLATHDGLVIDGMHMRLVESRGPAGIRTLLNNPIVELAVAEVDPQVIIDHGLGFDYCDVAVITSLSELSSPFKQPVETVLTQLVDAGGTLVLNADDTQVAAMANGAGRNVVLASVDAHNPHVDDHVRRSGVALSQHRSSDGATVSLVERGKTTAVIELDEIHDSWRTESEIGAIAAIATAVALNVPIETIRSALKTSERSGSA